MMWPSKTKMWNNKTRRIPVVATHNDKSMGNGKSSHEDDYEDEELEIQKLKSTVQMLSEKLEDMNKLLELKGAEMEGMRVRDNKNTLFMQELVMELVRVQASKPTAPPVSPAVAAYLAKKTDDTKGKAVAKLP